MWFLCAFGVRSYAPPRTRIVSAGGLINHFAGLESEGPMRKAEIHRQAQCGDGWIVVEADVRPMPVVLVQPVWQLRDAILRTGVRACLGPFAKVGLYKALGLAVGSWGVGLGAQVLNAQTAARRRQPTFSPRHHGAIAVTLIGPARVIAVASASDKQRRLPMKKNVGAVSSDALRHCAAGLCVRKQCQPPARCTTPNSVRSFKIASANNCTDLMLL